MDFSSPLRVTASFLNNALVGLGIMVAFNLNAILYANSQCKQVVFQTIGRTALFRYRSSVRQMGLHFAKVRAHVSQAEAYMNVH